MKNFDSFRYDKQFYTMCNTQGEMTKILYSWTGWNGTDSQLKPYCLQYVLALFRNQFNHS